MLLLEFADKLRNLLTKIFLMLYYSVLGFSFIWFLLILFSALAFAMLLKHYLVKYNKFINVMCVYFYFSKNMLDEWTVSNKWIYCLSTLWSVYTQFTIFLEWHQFRLFGNKYWLDICIPISLQSNKVFINSSPLCREEILHQVSKTIEMFIKLNIFITFFFIFTINVRVI